MKTKFNGILTLLLAFVVQISFAQEKTISGTVSDESGGLPGVSVLIKGTTKGTETDFDGKYSIKAKSGDVLVFSYLGYKTIEKTVANSSVINVKLEETGEVLETVVIESAYDVKRAKPTINSAITAVGAETIESRPNASIVQTLQGQAAGVNITTGSGQPGSNSEVIIRGTGSINGNSEPLFIIDGIPVDGDNFRSLNPNNIASVSVLKDAGATAIYGNRGANGVIIIKTKSGKFNSPLKIEYSSLTSFSTLQGQNYDLMNSTEQLELERTFGNGRGAGISDEEIAAIARYSNTNWVDVFFRTAQSQAHNLRLSSGSEKTTTNLSLGYLDQDGILVQSDLKRFNIDAKINGKSNNEKFNYGVSVSLNYSKSNEPNRIGGGAINRNYVLGAYMSVPYVSPEDYSNGEALLSPLLFSNTPLFLLDRLNTYTRFEEENKALISLNAGYQINDEFKLSTRLGMDYTNEVLTRAEEADSFNALLFAETGNDTPGFQDQQTTRAIGINWLNSLNYTKTIEEDHTINAGLYMEVFKAHLRTFGYRENGLDVKTFSPGDGSGFIGFSILNDDDGVDGNAAVINNDVANANILNSGLLSFFGSVDYDYKQKYGFGATLRRDASFRFRSSNRWGTFWSVSGRWNIDKESFMEDSPFSLLKLRGSYGVTGNQDIVASVGFNQYFVAPNNVLNLYGTGPGYGGANSIFVTNVANDDLQWETTTQANIGVDFEVFDRKLTGSFDYYIRETTDLFVAQPVPSYTGTTSLSVNSDGELRNSGIDLTLGYTPVNTENWRVKLNFAGNYNKSERFGANLSTIREGGPLGEYYVVRYAGVNPANGNLLFLDQNDNLTENPNQDTDRVFTNKNRFPDIQGSFGFDVDYKNFFLQTQFTFADGVYRFDNDYNDAIDPTAIGQFRHSRDILRAWTPSNRITDIPALRATNLAVASDRFLQSADYIRLRFVSLGYNVPKNYLSKIKLSKLRAFVNAENLLTITGWRGYDVEGFGSTGRVYPTPRTVSVGLEIGL